MNFRTITVALISLIALAGCENEELLKANSRIAQLELQTSQQASINDALMKEKSKIYSDLMEEKHKTVSLQGKLAQATATAHKERVAKNHLIDQVKGAKQVAGTAVDRAHAKGVKDAQVIAIKQLKPADKKS